MSIYKVYADQDYVKSKVPDGQGAYQQLATDKDGNIKWENKTGAIDSDRTKIFEGDLTLEEFTGANYYGQGTIIPMEIGKLYEISYGNETYPTQKCVRRAYGKDLPEVFILSKTPNIHLIRGGRNTYSYFQGDWEGSMHIVISEIAEDYVPTLEHLQQLPIATPCNEGVVQVSESRPISDEFLLQTKVLPVWIRPGDNKIYVDNPLPKNGSPKNFLRVNSEGDWVAEEVQTIPPASTENIGKMPVISEEGVWNLETLNVEWDSIKNKPFEAGSPTYIIPDGSIINISKMGISYEGIYTPNPYISLLEGNAYTLTCNEEIFEGICFIEDDYPTILFKDVNNLDAYKIQDYSDCYYIFPYEDYQVKGDITVSLTTSGQVKIKEDYIPTSVPLIQTASVGQTVVIKAVDENGKPTEWEVIDIPVQSVNGQTGAITVNAVPSCTTSDNDKVLMVVNGVPTWTTI